MLAKKIIVEAKRRGYLGMYIGINVNHGVAYIITRILATLLRYKHVGNYYLTIRFNNSSLFCKYIPFVLLLDVFYAPINLSKILIIKLWCKLVRKKYIVVIDEFYLTAIVEYLYFLEHLCRYKNQKILQKLYEFLFSLSIWILSKVGDYVNIILLEIDISSSIKGWIRREKQNIYDVNHFRFRTAGSRVFAEIFRNTNIASNIKIVRRTVSEPLTDIPLLLNEMLNLIQ